MSAIYYNKPRRSFAITLLALVMFFGTEPPPAMAMAMAMQYIQPKLYKVTNGTWGSAGAEMLVEKASVKLRFDSAEGEIPLALKKDKKGNFKVEGTYTKRGFGPIRVNKPLTAEPVIYEGRVTGTSMKFRITAVATGDLIGEFILTRGREAMIRGCR